MELNINLNFILRTNKEKELSESQTMGGRESPFLILCQLGYKFVPSNSAPLGQEQTQNLEYNYCTEPDQLISDFKFKGSKSSRKIGFEETK